MNQQQKYSQLENLYELFIFQGFKNMVFYWNFQDDKKIVNDKDGLSKLMKEGRVQNIYGVSEGLKAFSQGFSSEPISNFRYFITTYFKYTIFEVCSGVKIVLLSQVADPTDYYDTLRDIYFKGFLDFIKRDSFHLHGDPLNNPYFMEKVQELLEPFVGQKGIV